MIAGRPKQDVRTVPAQLVRKLRSPTAGADLVYAMDGDSADMGPDEGDMFSNLFANFTEWNSQADHTAYDRL